MLPHSGALDWNFGKCRSSGVHNRRTHVFPAAMAAAKALFRSIEETKKSLRGLENSLKTSNDIRANIPPEHGESHETETRAGAQARREEHFRHTSITGMLQDWPGNYWRRGGESNPRIKVLQTSALPLGYRAESIPLIPCRLRECQISFLIGRRHMRRTATATASWPTSLPLL